MLVAALQLVAIEWQSVTNDEAYHVYAGFSALRYDTNVFDLEQPPLVNLIAAAPLAAEEEPYAPRSALRDAVSTGEGTVADPSRPPEPGWHAVTVPIEQYVPAILTASPDQLQGYERLRTVAEQWERYLRALRLRGRDHGYAGETFHLYRIPEPPGGEG